MQYLTNNFLAINSATFDVANVSVNGTERFGSKTDFKVAMKGYFVVRLSEATCNQVLQREFRVVATEKNCGI